MKLNIPKFATKEELFTFLKSNVEDLIYQKKSELKRADDDFGFPLIKMIEPKIHQIKSKASEQDENSIKVRAIINTTYIRDSHKDVHIDGIWKKSLQENTRIKHLQEHQMAFDKVISDKGDLKAYTKKYTWKDLGYDNDGETEALVFDSNVKQSRNATMYKEYSEDNVDNHSVGMQYIKIKLAVNSSDDDYKEEKAEWDKHIDKIFNKEETEKEGYFWAVYEAKVIEGSAVPMGSNPLTPTIPIKSNIFDETNQLESAIKSWLKTE